jgi:hypothetical protein
MITPSPGEATSSAPQAASGIKVLASKSVRMIDIGYPFVKSRRERRRPALLASPFPIRAANPVP